MVNKFNLDYLEAMNNANDYLDALEDNLKFLQNNFKDNPEQLENILTLMKEDTETILELEDQLNMFLEQNQYQNVCNQLIITDMYHILVRDVLPDGDFECITEYLESMSEEKLIELLNALKRNNRFQDIVRENMVIGRSGNDTFEILYNNTRRLLNGAESGNESVAQDYADQKEALDRYRQEEQLFLQHSSTARCSRPR